MDPSMLLGFLIRSEEEWNEWKQAVATPPQPATTTEDGKKPKPIVHVHSTEPKYDSTSGMMGSREGEREGAVEEVQSCDDSDDETVV